MGGTVCTKAGATHTDISAQCNEVVIVVQSPAEVKVNYEKLLCHLNQECESFSVAVKGIKVDYFGYVPEYLSSGFVSGAQPLVSFTQPALNYTVYYQMAGVDPTSPGIPPDVMDVVSCTLKCLKSSLPDVHIYNYPTAIPLQITPQS